MAAERTLPARRSAASLVRLALRNPARTCTVAVATLLLATIGVRIWLAGQIASPWIMVDELLYTETAKSVASTGEFLVRGQPIPNVSVLYQSAIAPAWWADSMATTYGLAKAINVLLMTATAVPLYLWARRLVVPWRALVAIVLFLLLPSLVYTGMMMTENAFLPAFTLAAFAIALALERPTFVLQACALGAVVLATFVRLQGLVLLAVLPVAILLKVLFELRVAPRERPLRFVAAELRRYWPSAVLLGAAVAAYAAREVARGRSLSSGFGSYQVVADSHYSFGAVRHWVLLHFAELPLAAGVLPACALLLLAGIAAKRGGTRSEAERAFLAVAVAAVALVVVEAAVFASRFSFRIEERYMFFVTPLLLLAFVLWLDRGVPRPPVLTFAAAVIPALLVLRLPLGSLLNVSILSDTFGLIPFLRLSEHASGGVSTARNVLLAGGFAAAALFALWPRRAYPSLVLPAAVAVFLVLSSYPIVRTLHNYSVNLRNTAGSEGSPSWIDQRLGTGGKATFLLGTTADPWPETLALWQTEFWNRSLRSVDNLGPPEPGALAATGARIDLATGFVVDSATGAPLRARYVVSEQPFRLAGQVVALRPPLVLYRTTGRLRVAETTTGIYGDGWMGSDAFFTRFTKQAPGQIAVTISRAAWRGPDIPGRVSIVLSPRAGSTLAKSLAKRSWVVHSGRARRFLLPTPLDPFTISVHVAPTFSPSTYGQPDTRQLGAQVAFQPVPRSAR
jgi:hypothetical protein